MLNEDRETLCLNAIDIFSTKNDVKSDKEPGFGLGSWHHKKTKNLISNFSNFPDELHGESSIIFIVFEIIFSYNDIILSNDFEEKL